MPVTVEVLNAARMQKALEKRYRWPDGTVSTLRDRLEDFPPVSKSINREVYSSKRVHLEYRELTKPKLTYSLWWQDAPDAREYGCDVPKLVWDMVNVPARKTGYWPEEEVL